MIRSDSVSLAGASTSTLTTSPPSAAVSRHQSATAELLGPRPRATPAAANVLGVDDAGQRAAQHLATLAERRARRARTARRGRRRVAGGGRSDERRLDVRAAARTPTPARCRRRVPSAQYATFTLTRAVLLRCRAGGQPLGDLALHHHEHRARSPARRRAGRTPAAWRRCRAGWRRASSRPSPASSAGQSSVMASASTTVTSATVGDDLAQHRHEPAVDLDRRHRRPGLGERQRQRAETGADLDHVVAGADAGQAGDAADGVRVGDEVLAEVAAGRQAADSRAGRGCGRGSASPGISTAPVTRWTHATAPGSVRR